MEINKQLFEDVLSGKLKGTFITRNGCKIDSDMICRNTDDSYSSEHEKDCYPYMHVKNHAKTYTISGKINEFYPHHFDFVDFIPNTNMETKELKITIPENHEIDWQESAKKEKIVFKKKDTKPRSWEEYCKQQVELRKKGYFIGIASNLAECNWPNMTFCEMWGNVLPSKELAKAFLAMMQLMSLRQAWIGDWKPDWNDSTNNFVIQCECNKLLVDSWKCMSRPLSFPTQEMALDFMICFKDLLEIAKPLI